MIVEYQRIFPEESGGNTTISVCFNKKELLSLGVCEGAVDLDPTYLGKTEFSKLQKLWKDPLYLADFFEDNFSFFQDPFWEGVNEVIFVNEVARQSLIVFKEIESLLKSGNLLEQFAALDTENDIKRVKGEPFKVKAKYGNLSGRLIFRIYGLFLKDNTICITGGALKIVEKMEDAPNTQLELNKMNHVMRDLQANDVFDRDSFIDFIVE